VGFLIRLFGVLVAVAAALRIAGINERDLAVGGAFTAVVLGLAAQQTLANVFAGMVLLSARPFRVGERVRFQGGNIAGATEGTVESLGLMYVTLRQGADTILLPNAAALGSAVQPLREPAKVDFTARLRPGVRVSDVQRLLEILVDVPPASRRGSTSRAWTTTRSSCASPPPRSIRRTAGGWRTRCSPQSTRWSPRT
jgi:small conductance mechanosensitive channel